MARSAYQIAPITGREALRWIADNHRHLPKLQGALFAVSVEWLGIRVGVATVGNPARVWQGTGRVVVSRCAVVPDLPKVVDSMGREHAAPVCSMLYGRCAEAAAALGYAEIWTYTLGHETGSSLRAAGFRRMGDSPASGTWAASRPGRQPMETGVKGRWMRKLWT